MALQNVRSPNFENFGIPNLGVSRQNDIWMQLLWLITDNTIRGKVLISPKFGCGEFCEFVDARGSFVHQKCFNYAQINLLFGLCRSVWIIDLLATHPSFHPRPSACPLPLKCCKLKSIHWLLLFSLSNLHLSLSRSAMVRHKILLIEKFLSFKMSIMWQNLILNIKIVLHIDELTIIGAHFAYLMRQGDWSLNPWDQA
jgi:hypothetical protein